MDFSPLSAKQLANLFINGIMNPDQRPVVILGAGASIPSLPSAYDLKVEIATNALKQAFYKIDRVEPLSAEEEKQLELGIECIQSKCEQHHITLEVLVSLISFRSNDHFNTDAMWNALCQDSSVNEFSFIIAMLIKYNCIHRILTSNFDHMLQDACHMVGAENYEVVTNVQLESKTSKSNGTKTQFQNNPMITQICPFHGTTYEDKGKKDGVLSPLKSYTEPFTATATGLAKSFSKHMYEYIENSIQDNNRPVIVFGYSGNDHFDLNPLLSALRLNKSESNRKNWYWIVHGGSSNNVSNSIKKIFGVEGNSDNYGLYGGDTLSLMRVAFQFIQKEFPTSATDAVLPTYQWKRSQTTYQQRLSQWFTENFDWSKQEGNDMILDLQNNLVAAWIVSEHYRLVQLGYDEEYSFRFAGVFDIDSTSRVIGNYPHLALQFPAVDETPPMVVEFGYILEAARIYRIEMNDSDQKFPVTSHAMNQFIDQAKAAIEYSPRKSETAALLIGLSIAYDYLGLIGGRKVTTLLKKLKKLKESSKTGDSAILGEEEKLDDARFEASEGFEKCIEYATLAKDTMTSSLSKLIPAATWIQVGTDNMGRFKEPGSDEAIEWLTKAIEGRKAMIEDEIEQSKMKGETNVSTSKIVSVEMHFPPLWRRGGELVQQILETQGFNTAPNKLVHELNKERRKLLQFGFITSENAYKRHQRWNAAPNQNFPAVYDCRVLVALAKGNVLEARNAVDACRDELLHLPEMSYSSAKRRSLETWIMNIEARIEDFVLKHDSEKSFCSKCLIM